MKIRSQRRKSRTGIVLAAATLLVFSQASIADWTFDPVLRAAWDYDDNATLSVRTDEEEQISGIIGEASIDIVNRQEKGFFSFRPRLRSRTYDSDSDSARDRDSDDQFIDFRSSYRSERNDFGLSADYARESVRTAELADADLDTEIDPDDISDDETGAVSTQARRERLRVTPRWTYRVSDLSSIDANVRYLTVDYEDRDPLSTLFDYSDTRLSLTYRRNLSSRSSATITVSGRDYTTERPNGDRTGYGVAAGYNRFLTETTQLRALVGVEQTEQDDLTQSASGDDQSLVTDISLVRNLETIRLLAQYRQRVSPSGRGQLSTRDEFNLRFSRTLNDRFRAGLGARAYSVTSVDNQANKQDYVQLRGELIWRLTQTISMEANYRHTVLNRESLGEGADSNRITLWFTYKPIQATAN